MFTVPKNIYCMARNLNISSERFLDPTQKTGLHMSGFARPRVSMMMNDVHYYLGGYSPSYDCTMYISGGLFYGVPGTYDLPFREGRFTVSQ